MDACLVWEPKPTDWQAESLKFIIVNDKCLSSPGLRFTLSCSCASKSHLFLCVAEMSKGPISNVYITGGSSANGARYPARWEVLSVFQQCEQTQLLRHQFSKKQNVPFPRFAVMDALMAPWPPAQMTLTTAGLAWRLQFLIWGMTMTRTSMTRMTTKTNLSTPRNSNKHSPSNHLHCGKLVPFLCVLLWPFSPPPRFQCLYFCLAFSGV